MDFSLVLILDKLSPPSSLLALPTLTFTFKLSSFLERSSCFLGGTDESKAGLPSLP
jgi:hypothetical protein